MTTIQDNEQLGGQKYPLLDGYEWRIESTDISDEEAVKWVRAPSETPQLRWVRQDRVEDLYTDAPLKFDLSMAKGGFVLSKRISRIMRPYFYWALLKKVDIYYDPDLDPKTWDGAGLIRKGFLERLMHHLPENKEDMLRKRLRKAGRVEFTVLSERGEDKGHALVVSNLEHDIVLPCDTKTEIKWLDGRTMVGVQPISSHDEMWVDVQSLINLHPFLDNAHYLKWLEDAGNKHLRDIESGKMDWDDDDVLHLDVDKAWQWPIMDYLTSGGKAMWFSGIVKALASQHIRMVQARGLDHIRLPVPGGRYYVFVDTVGGKAIPPGRILLDPKHATAWVSSEDWPSLAETWGGADQDDMLWCLPFRKTTGDLAVIAWRSPNQPGEYAILEPMEDILWAEWPDLDETQLPIPIKEQKHTYEVNLEKHSFPDIAYSIGAMTRSLDAAQNNIGMPGMYINLLMALQAVNRELPEPLSCRIEDIMDAIAKIGADTSPVKAWVWKFAYKYYTEHPEVPESLVNRVTGLLPRDQREILRHLPNHWLDELMGGIVDHLERFQEKRNELASRCMPPVAVLDYGKDYVSEAGEVRAAYSNIIRGRQDEDIKELFEAAWQASLKVLEKYHGKWQGIMAGIAVRTYAYDDEVHSDAVMWQPGVVRTTIEMLRDIGVIGDLVTTKHGNIVQYRKAADLSSGTLLRVNGPWFSLANSGFKAQGKRTYSKMGDISRPLRDAIKERTRQIAHEGKFNRVLTTKHEGDRAIVYMDGELLGYIQKGQEGRIGDMFSPIWATAEDGNLRLVVKENG